MSMTHEPTMAAASVTAFSTAVENAVKRAQGAGQWWENLGFALRRRYLRLWASRLANSAEEIAHICQMETGKPIPIGVAELTLAVDHLVWAANNARRVLGERRVPTTALQPEYSARVSYRAVGAVGIITPTDFSLFSPIGTTSMALASGNAVILKPSEYATETAQYVMRSFTEVVDSAPVVQVLTGDGAAGEALCRSDVDMVSFTGTTDVGKHIMNICSETLKPVLLECGGKDAMIVDADADVAAAASAACFAGMANTGQNCVAIERIYAVDEVYDEFLRRLIQAAARLRVGSDPYDDLGPVTKPERLTVVREQISDALSRGAHAVLGGVNAVQPPYIHPTILVNVPADARVLHEETLGPVMVVARAADAREALNMANTAEYGLGGSVFGKHNAEVLAHRMNTGMVSVNSVLAFATQPACPFGGTGESGMGRIHGEDGLRAFTQVRAVTKRRFPSPVPVLTFDRDPQRVVTQMTRLLQMRHGRYS